MPVEATLTDCISALALAVAVLVYIWQINTNRRQRKYDKSAFRLKSALAAFQAAHTLLKDGINDRIIWIAAARALKRGTAWRLAFPRRFIKTFLKFVRIDIGAYSVKF